MLNEPLPAEVAALGIPLPALVVWLRHVGWTFFGEPLAQLRELEPDIAEAGIAVRFVVIGTPELALEFCSRFGDAQRCIADPEKRTYKAMGLEQYNLWRLFTDRALRARRKANKAAGFRQNWRATRMENAAQLPGAAFIDRDGIVRWIYRGKHPGDLPSMREMFETIASFRHE